MLFFSWIFQEAQEMVLLKFIRLEQPQLPARPSLEQLSHLIKISLHYPEYYDHSFHQKRFVNEDDSNGSCVNIHTLALFQKYVCQVQCCFYYHVQSANTEFIFLTNSPVEHFYTPDPRLASLQK